MSAATPPLVCILGRVTVQGPTGPRPVPGRLDRAVLVQLTLAQSRPVPVELLIESLWPDVPPAGALNALQVKVSRLRGLLGEQGHRLEYVNRCYRLRLDPSETDVGRLAVRIEEAELALRDGDHASARVTLAPLLDTWWGALLSEFPLDSRVVAASARLDELHASALEAYAEARLADPVTRGTAMADLRAILESDPLRPRARRLLMLGLDASGRRADALAVYDAGRRLSGSLGLEPPEELKATFRRLLQAEREQTRRASRLRPAKPVAKDSLLQAARWLADDGDVPGALQLGIRGAWWWWSGGRREPARELLADLLQRSEDACVPTGPVQLRAQAWVGLFGSTTAQAAMNLTVAERALMAAPRPRWTRHDALAAVLVAERLHDRGEPTRARRLLALAAGHYERAGEAWGVALCAAVTSRGQLLGGAVIAAEKTAEEALMALRGLEDAAGQVMTLDTLGYCAEVRGHLARAEALHAAALRLARQLESPEWEAAQLTRLGNVRALAGARTAVGDLMAAARLSAESGSGTVAALARNGLGVAFTFGGERSAAADEHLAAWNYYTAACSTAGLAYTGARLALVHGDSSEGGTRWAVESLHHSVASKDPRAIAHSLEALALVSPNPRDATRALAAATVLRRRTMAPLPDVQQRPLTSRRRSLARVLGPSTFEPVWRDAATEPLMTAATW